MDVLKSIRYEILDDDGYTIVEVEFLDGEVSLGLPDNGFKALCGNYFDLSKMSDILKEIQKAIKEENK